MPTLKVVLMGINKKKNTLVLRVMTDLLLTGRQILGVVENINLQRKDKAVILIQKSDSDSLQ